MKLTLEQHEFTVLKGIIDDRLNSLKKNIARHSDNLDEYRQTGEVVGVDVQPIKDIREVMFELFRGAY